MFNENKLLKLMEDPDNWNYLDWHEINENLNLSEEFMDKHWQFIWDSNNSLIDSSEEFLFKHKNDIKEWYKICCWRKNISIEFVYKFIDKIDIDGLRHNENIKLSRKEIDAIKVAQKLLGR